MKLNENETKVLKVLSNIKSYGYGDVYYCFQPICKRTGLNRQQVRLACRSLARKGLAKYSRGLWSEEGEPRGAGYTATEKGKLAEVKGERDAIK